VDGIVAIVGDTAITWSELQEYVFRFQAQGIPVPEDPEQRMRFMRDALDQKINETILLVHAAREGITVTDAEIEGVVEERITAVRRRFRTEAEFEQALRSEGTDPADYRMRLGTQARAELTIQRYLQRKVSELQPVAVSEQEIRDRFEAQRQYLGSKPASVTLSQVVIPTRPSDDARLRADERAQQALSRAQSGEDFARLAREYSDDAATREAGGDLGWVRRGQLLPEFEEALFSMRLGEVRGLVETSIGHHIIKLERARGNERQARHILIRPETTPADGQRAAALADSVAAALRAGADLDSLVRTYGDPGEQSRLTGFALDRLPEAYRARLQGAAEGAVLDPFELSAAPTMSKWFVVRVERIDPGGEWTLDDLRERLRLQIQEETMIGKVVERLKDQTYIALRLDAYPIAR
jgi:peptidyl-prolyl cis-trans isomerase SurA